jgi:hypothetical protein
MRQVLTILMVIGLIWAGAKFKAYFSQRMAEQQAKLEGPPRTAPGKLPGLDPSLEASLETAKKAGADGVRDWLRLHRSEVEDPRLAEIDLDYVVLVGRSNPGEAKRVLRAVKPRVAAGTPLHKRLLQLEQVYP